MPYVPTTYGQVFIALRGEGQPALLCLHGAGGSHQHWGYQIADWSRLTRTLMVDLPGHGRSAPPGCTRIAGYSRVVLALLDMLRLDQAVLVGHSMGGAVALWTALNAAQRVAGLVLVGTGARLRVAPDLLDGLRDAPAATVARISDMMYAPHAPADLREAGNQAFQQNDPAVFRNDLVACDAFDVREQVAQIACPTLILCGAQDAMTPPKFSQFLHQQIAGSHLTLLSAAGHMPQIEQPQQLTAAVAEWFTSQYRSD